MVETADLLVVGGGIVGCAVTLHCAQLLPKSTRIVLLDRPQSPQSVILAGAVLPVTGRDDLLVINAANEILANNFLSRINQDIREARGWSYGLRGFLNTFEHQTPYIINAPVQADRRQSFAVRAKLHCRNRGRMGRHAQQALTRPKIHRLK